MFNFCRIHILLCWRSVELEKNYLYIERGSLGPGSMMAVCLVQWLLQELEQSSPPKFHSTLFEFENYCLQQNHPVCVCVCVCEISVSTLQLLRRQIPKIIVRFLLLSLLKMKNFTQNFLFHVFAKMILLDFWS